MAAEVGQVFLIENLGDKTHTCAYVERFAVACGDSCALLAPVLKGVKAVEGEARYVVPGAIHPKNATRLARIVIFRDH